MSKIPYIVRYSFKRILLLLFSTFVILTIVFFLIKVLPGETMIGNEPAKFSYCENQVTLGYFVSYPQEMKNLGTCVFNYTDPNGLQYFFYKKPIILQYFAWLKGIFTQWNWGVSSALQPESSAIRIIFERIGVTVSINVIAIVIAVPLGFIFGIIAALNKNKPIDHVLSTIVMIFISVPSFVIISLLLLIFSYTFRILPNTWPSSSAAISVVNYILPVAAICFGTVASFTRYTRAELCEVMSSEFLLLARTKGLTKSQCVVRHALRNSLVPIVPMIIGEFVGILSGSFVLEGIYGIPGIGGLFVNSINAKDWNVLLVDMAVTTIIGLVANLICDLSYGIVDPRIRMGAKAA